MDAKNTAAKQTKEKVEDQLENVIDKAEGTFEAYKGKVSNNLSNIADKVHKKVDSGQDFLDDKANDVGKYVHQTVDKANKLGHRAADVLTDSSDYVKNFDIERARESVKVAITEKPEVTIAVVALIGLVVGFLVGRKSA